MQRAGAGAIRLLAAIAWLAVLAGCAVPPRPVPASDAGAQFALAALALVGVPYRLGGEDPATGLDCSGLVRVAARSALGIELPRQAEAMSQVGEAVDPTQLRVGDLVFFNTQGRPYSHVGIYLDDGNFVHAPTQRGVVRVERLWQSYWRTRFDGARRIGNGARPGPAAGGGAAAAVLAAPAPP